MGVGSFLEPLIVVTLLLGGSYFNRNKDYSISQGRSTWTGDKTYKRSDDVGKSRESEESLIGSGWSSPTLAPYDVPTFRRRKLQFLGWRRVISTPNTLIFKDRLLSRVMQKFPFLAEAWYWFLIYFVCTVALFYMLVFRLTRNTGLSSRSCHHCFNPR